MENVNIVIIDDHNFFAESLEKFLKNFSIFFEFKLENVKVLNSGKEAVKFVNNFNVDIVIIDFNMPELNGIETSRLIKEKKDNVKIILYSMYDINFENKPPYIDAILKKDEIFEKLIPVIKSFYS